MAGDLTPKFPVTIADDPVVTAAGGVDKSRWNLGVKLTGGTDKQIVERSTAADGTTGMNLTSAPTAASVVFLSGTPSGTPAAGTTWFWVEDDGTNVYIRVKRSDASIVQLVL